MKSNQKTEFLVGIFLLSGLLMLGFIIIEFGNIGEWFKGSHTLRVSFKNAMGIKKGSPVELGGTRIGKVKDTPMLNRDKNGVIITLEFSKNIKIPVDSTITIASNGLMGDALISITNTNSNPDQFHLFDTQEIITGSTGSGLSDLQSTAETVAKNANSAIDDVRSALADIKTALTNLNQDTFSPQTLSQFKQTLTNLNQASQKLDQTILSTTTTTDLQQAIANLKDASTHFKNASQVLDQRLPIVFDKTDKTLTQAHQTLQTVQTTAENYTQIAKNIRNSQGILGSLISDPQLKTDLKDLITNLKNHGVLFYKNSAEKNRPTPQKKS
jgi:phospholipid/cholesterol/gamma-HCH transport system substrate-binding protein